MRFERLLQTLLVAGLATFALMVFTFSASWAARLLSTEEMAQIHGGTDDPPTAKAKAEDVTTTAYVLQRKLVQFNGSGSIGNNLTFSWIFGDGGSSSDSNPTHRYTSTGTYTATLTVTNSGGSHQDTVTVEVMDPWVVKVDFTGTGEHTMKDSSGTTITDPIWDSTVVGYYYQHTSGDKDKPAAYTRNSKPTVKGKVWCKNNLTKSTSIHLDTFGPNSMDFDSDGGSIQNGISAYFTLPSSNGGNDKFKNFVYKYGPTVGYGTPNHSDYLLQWKYRINGNSTWMDTENDTDHVIYLTLSTPRESESTPSETVLDFACGWAENKTTADLVSVDILDNGFKDHYTYNYQCHLFSSDFCRMVESLGISCTLHQWSVPLAWRTLDIISVDQMMAQETISISTVGNTGSEKWQFSFHQWAEAGGKIRDPSTGSSYSGSWGSYEDYVYGDYAKCTIASSDPGGPAGTWGEGNQSGQSTGVEAVGNRYYGTESPLSWLGPDRNP